jgi:hypothetical protein
MKGPHCRAITGRRAGRKRCKNHAKCGALCKRHARMLAGAAGDSFKWYKMKINNFPDLNDLELQEAVADLFSGKSRPRPRKARAYMELVEHMMKENRGQWFSINEIQELVQEWSGREFATRSIGQAMRMLTSKGDMERKYARNKHNETVTLWRYKPLTIQQQGQQL